MMSVSPATSEATRVAPFGNGADAQLLHRRRAAPVVLVGGQVVAVAGHPVDVLPRAGAHRLPVRLGLSHLLGMGLRFDRDICEAAQQQRRRRGSLDVDGMIVHDLGARDAGNACLARVDLLRVDDVVDRELDIGCRERRAVMPLHALAQEETPVCRADRLPFLGQCRHQLVIVVACDQRLPGLVAQAQGDIGAARGRNRIGEERGAHHQHILVLLRLRRRRADGDGKQCRQSCFQDPTHLHLLVDDSPVLDFLRSHFHGFLLAAFALARASTQSSTTPSAVGCQGRVS